MKLKMASILVEDPISAHEFYTEVLGFKSHTFMPDHQLAIVMASDDNTATIILEPVSHDYVRNFKTKIYQAGLPCIIFEVDDVQAHYDALIEKGVNFRQPPKTTEWGTSIILDDQHGNYIQLHKDPTP